MYSMVLMAALTTGTDMPDRRGGCCGCCGGCYGMGMGCGGCYGMGMGCGGCYGMGMGRGGCWGGGYHMGMGWGGWGHGYGGGYALGGYAPMYGGYAYSPGYSGYAYSPGISSWGWGAPIDSSGGTVVNPLTTTQSFYFNPAAPNEATLIVHLPEAASLRVDGQQMRQSSSTRIFTSPPLEQGKTYVYTVTAEINRNGHSVKDSRDVEVRAGQRSEVTMNFGEAIPSAPRPKESPGSTTPPQ